MSAGSPINPDALQQLADQVGQASQLASQVIPAHTQQINRVTGYAALGLASLPLLSSILKLLHGLFQHHADAAKVAATQPATVPSTTGQNTTK